MSAYCSYIGGVCEYGNNALKCAAASTKNCAAVKAANEALKAKGIAAS